MNCLFSGYIIYPIKVFRATTCNSRFGQPHVRPIQRGKRSNPIEFGQKLHLPLKDGYTYLEQTGWLNFNEGGDLKTTVEEFRRKFGHYPEAVLADKIYQTRVNRRYRKALGICF